MHSSESVLEYKTHKIPWDLEIQTDYLIPARRADLVLINKKKRICYLVDLAIPVDCWVRIKKSKKKKRQILEPFQKKENYGT